MLKTIRQFFTPPVFPDNEDKTRAARILALLANMLAITALAFVAVIQVDHGATFYFTLGGAL